VEIAKDAVNDKHFDADISEDASLKVLGIIL